MEILPSLLVSCRRHCVKRSRAPGTGWPYWSCRDPACFLLHLAPPGPIPESWGAQRVKPASIEFTDAISQQIKRSDGVEITKRSAAVQEGSMIHTGFRNQSLLWLSFSVPQGHLWAAFPTLSEIDIRWGCRTSAEHLWTGLPCSPVK